MSLNREGLGNGQKCNMGHGNLMGMERKCDKQYGRIVTRCILVFTNALEVKQLLKGKKVLEQECVSYTDYIVEVSVPMIILFRY